MSKLTFKRKCKAEWRRRHGSTPKSKVGGKIQAQLSDFTDPQKQWLQRKQEIITTIVQEGCIVLRAYPARRYNVLLRNCNTVRGQLLRDIERLLKEGTVVRVRTGGRLADKTEDKLSGWRGRGKQYTQIKLP